MRGDNTRARERLGWRPRWSLEDGLAKTIDWYRGEVADAGSQFTTG
jgi:CDP-glucose 4,6-dehydratase